MSCCVNSSLKNDSDHHSIFTQFSLDKQLQVMKHCHNWKKMNIENIATEIQYLQQFRNLYSSVNIENYINYLLKFINQLIENIMLWFKSVLKYSCRWWTLKVQNAMHQAQAVYHQQVSVKKICALNQIKKKIIHRVKTA